MKGYRPGMSFGEEIAALYRDVLRGDEDDAVAFLAARAGAGPALELAIGAGRIALPLAARGVRVDGVDFSEAMIAQLRSKPGGAEVSVVLGDFADVPVSGKYRLIYVVWNTLFNLLTQDDQVRCFRNVAGRLTDDGAFVVEADSPAFLYRLRDGQYVDAESVETDAVKLDVAKFDAATQVLEESHLTLTARGVRLAPIVTRYAWPAELDLMARIAGLRLEERWGGWRREPFTGSGRVVSVFAR